MSYIHKNRKRESRENEDSEWGDTGVDLMAGDDGDQDAIHDEANDAGQTLYSLGGQQADDDGTHADVSNNEDSSDDASSADELSTFKRIAAETAKDFNTVGVSTPVCKSTNVSRSSSQPSGSATKLENRRRPPSPTVILPTRSCLRKPSTGTPPKRKRAVTFSSPIVSGDPADQGREKRKKTSDRQHEANSSSSSQAPLPSAARAAHDIPSNDHETGNSGSNEAKKTSPRKPINYTKSTSHHFGKPPPEQSPTEPKQPSPETDQPSAESEQPPTEQTVFVPPAPPCSPSSSKFLIKELTLAQQPSQRSPKTRPPAGTVSALTFPSTDAPCFGLIQEQLAMSPFELLVAVYLLKKTAGRQAFPVLWELLSEYPTPVKMAEADVQDIMGIIKHLGLQNVRSRDLNVMARQWCEDPPEPGRRHRKLHYPLHGCGSDIKPKEGPINDETIDDRVGAYEIAHLRGVGEYGLDSWRIFCRDVLRGVAEGYQGEGAAKGFEPEWKRVLPKDKELRAFLRWMWLKEGWAWDAYTGRKTKASKELMSAARRGGIVWEPPEVPRNTDTNADEENEDTDQDAEPKSSKKSESKSRTDTMTDPESDPSPRKTIKLFGNQVLSFPAPPPATSTAPTIPSMFAAATSGNPSSSTTTPRRPSRNALGKRPFGPIVNIAPTSPEEASPNTQAFNAACDKCMPERYCAPDTRRCARKTAELRKAVLDEQQTRDGSTQRKSDDTTGGRSQMSGGAHDAAAHGKSAVDRANPPTPRHAAQRPSASQPVRSKPEWPKSKRTSSTRSSSATGQPTARHSTKPTEHTAIGCDLRDGFDTAAGEEAVDVSPDTGFDTDDGPTLSSSGRAAGAGVPAQPHTNADAYASTNPDNAKERGRHEGEKKEKVGTKEERRAARDAKRKKKAHRRESKRLYLERRAQEGG